MSVLSRIAHLFRRRQRRATRHFGSEPELDVGCPLGAHRRLLDAHALWHQAAAGYDDADTFRANLNACIEQMRSVTLVLQAEKDKISEFDAWYEPWRQRLKADVVMVWLNAARVQVFHIGDLAAQSRVRISVQRFAAGAGHPIEFDLPADVPLAAVVAETRHQLRHFPGVEGLAVVERRWVANDLPDHELLEALATCYRQLDAVVADAHQHLADGARDVAAVNPECLARAPDARLSRIDMATGQTMRFEPYDMQFTPELLERAKRRYGFGREAPSGPAARTLEDRAEQYVELSKRILARDKEHVPMLTLLLPDGTAVPHLLVFSDAADKFAQWQHVATEVDRLGAHALVFVAEAWRRSPEDGHILGEVLTVTLATDDGAVISWGTSFKRRFGRIVFEKTQRMEEQQAFYLRPVQKVWRAKRPAPDVGLAPPSA